MAQSDKRRRRKHQQFKVKMARGFMQALVNDANEWERKGLTAEEIIQDVREKSENVAMMLREIG